MAFSALWAVNPEVSGNLRKRQMRSGVGFDHYDNCQASCGIRRMSAPSCRFNRSPQRSFRIAAIRAERSISASAMTGSRDGGVVPEISSNIRKRVCLTWWRYDPTISMEQQKTGFNYGNFSQNGISRC